MLVDVLTLFPDYLAPLGLSLVGKARAAGLLEVRTTDPRDFTADVHRTVDDSPYGGGPGMVMKPEPWGQALDSVLARGGPSPAPVLVVPTPAGRPFTQQLAAELAAEPWLAFACGRYEGIDSRVAVDAARRMRVLEVSLGDYVLAGGEVAVLVVVEAVARLLPGVLGNRASHEQDSFSDGLLEGPSYTRPPVWRDLEVPAVLLSGDHAAIARWRREQALERTAALRPELLERVALSDADRRSAGAPVAGCGRVEGCCDRPDAGCARSPAHLGAALARALKDRPPMHILDELDARQLRTDVPEFRPGDTLDVGVRVVEGNRSRVQRFQGVVIRRSGGGVRETFTVRKVSFGVGVERTFPVHTPVIEEIKVVTRGDVRRAKLYYLRELRGKKAKIKEKRDASQVAKAKGPATTPAGSSAGAGGTSATTA